MKRNITIALEEDLAKEARILAAEKDSSVSQLLADYLRVIVKAGENKLKAKKDFFLLTQKHYPLNYSKRNFRRGDLYER